VALRPKFNFVVIDPGSGKARPGAWVTVYGSNTLDKATLYADDDVTTLANPVQANGLGQVAVRVAPGIYDISMSWDGAQPTVVEDVLAWTPEGAILSAPGDLLVGSASGPVALHVGHENQLLVVDQGMPAWKHLASSDGAPAGPAGSLMVYGTTGGVQIIPPGTQEQTLAMVGGAPTWSSLLPAGTVLPIQSPGDLVVGAPSTGLAARLAVGALGSALTVSDNNTLVWAEPGAVGPGMGQCYLTYETPTSLWLTPYQGNKIWVNGRSRTIPDGGIRLAPTGLTIFSTYYIYVAWTGSALQLEASTVGFQQTGGHWHKAGDPSRTLVGYAWVHESPTVAGAPIWTDKPDLRGVLSLFNQDERTASASLSAPRSTSSPTPVELNTEIRSYFIAWGFTNVTMTLTGTAYSNTSGTGFASYLVLDGEGLSGTLTSAITANVHLNIATAITKQLPAENKLHAVTMHGVVVSGIESSTITWYGDAARILSCRTAVTIST